MVQLNNWIHWSNMINRSLIFANTSYNTKPRKALFLDRDGVLIHDVHYISKADDVVVYKQAYNFLAHMKKKGYLLIIVTNQSGIGRGKSTWNDYYSVTDEMIKQLRCIEFDAILANSETEVIDYKHSWRKPAIGMFDTTCRLLNINLHQSIMIGDRLTDLLAAFNCGITKLYHLESGHGMDERSQVHEFEKTTKFTTSNSSICYAKSIDDLIDREW